MAALFIQTNRVINWVLARRGYRTHLSVDGVSDADEQISANLESQIDIFHAAGITSVSEILAVRGVNLSFPELYHEIEDLQFQ